MPKPTTNIWARNSILMKNQDSSNIWTPTTCMVGRCPNLFLLEIYFKWIDEKEKENWFEFSNQEWCGCILEVDLEYPKGLHDLHNDYPERLMVNRVEKLIPNLRDKKNYVLHYLSLKQYLDMGLKIKKIHRGISFFEDEWLKQYINLNTQLRTKASNEFEKDFFKLMYNSVFGKMMENIRNRVNVHLVNSQKSLKRYSQKPNFHHLTIFDENLVAVNMKKTELVFNKPVYLGMSILDISKTLMNDFHYNYIKKKYGSKAKLLMTDTDSFVYEIKTEDFFKDISGDVREKFDTSNFPQNHPSGILTGFDKKVPGVFKDECGRESITEFTGLRAKLYAFSKNGEESKRCKGAINPLYQSRFVLRTTKTVCLQEKNNSKP